MTRINIGIPPRLLSDKHLLAEHREIKRIPNHLRKYGLACTKNIPKEFTLGKGHVLFFIDKGKYTMTRYVSIFEECVNRGFRVESYIKAWEIYMDSYMMSTLFNDYKPTKKDITIIAQRLELKDPDHYGPMIAMKAIIANGLTMFVPNE